jgi:hypothetical protein
MVATGETASAERHAQKTYWLQHSSQPTVEAMMLDSKASEIDQLERPEVSAHFERWLVSQKEQACQPDDCTSEGQQQHSSEDSSTQLSG